MAAANGPLTRTTDDKATHPPGSERFAAAARSGPASPVTLILAIACFFLWRANKASNVKPDEVVIEPAVQPLEAVGV